ncbi:hypothetical protein [Caballeronia calidae]|uniref:hypothetical protein n=1 Tax=Caballeronia calidae TaxID=1777139 RepID=UPI0012FD5BB0|nr:hypothetical protein [Caballeronia calidae]
MSVTIVKRRIEERARRANSRRMKWMELVHSFRAQACGYPEHRRRNVLMRNAFNPPCEIRALLRLPL